MKTCKICGEPFVPEHNAQRICRNDHMNKCPVCYKYIVWNSTKPVKPCCPECVKIKRANTNKMKYGCSNVMQIDSTKAFRSDKKVNTKHNLLPMKLPEQNSIEEPRFRIDETTMNVYMLSEIASKEFLKHYGFRYVHKFGRTHLSIGLVKDGILYQMIRFEKRPKEEFITLVDFGTRFGYFNPRGYSKLVEAAYQYKGVEEFVANIPRNIATELTIKSLGLTMVNEGDYEVYWIQDNKLRKLTCWNNIPEMLQKYDYVTTDYIDHYRSISESS